MPDEYWNDAADLVEYYGIDPKSRKGKSVVRAIIIGIGNLAADLVHPVKHYPREEP